MIFEIMFNDYIVFNDYQIRLRCFLVRLNYLLKLIRVIMTYIISISKNEIPKSKIESKNYYSKLTTILAKLSYKYTYFNLNKIKLG